MGGRGQQRHRPATGAATAGRRRARRGRVPAKLSARARLFDTGHNRKTDAHDAHAVAVVAVRTKTLRVLSYDAELEVLRMLVDHRDELAKAKVQAANRLQRLLSNSFGTGQEGHHRAAGQGHLGRCAATGRGRQDA